MVDLAKIRIGSVKTVPTRYGGVVAVFRHDEDEFEIAGKGKYRLSLDQTRRVLRLDYDSMWFVVLMLRKTGPENLTAAIAHAIKNHRGTR